MDSIRQVCINFAVAAAVAMTSSHALAQSWPVKPVTVVVPTTAGSGLDVIARFLNEGLSERLGQPFIVENRAGANAAIGAQAVARAAPDGNTLLVGTASSHGINPHMFKSLGFDPINDFQPVTTLLTLGFVLVVNPQTVPVNSVAELTAYLNARPGKLAYASGNASAIFAAPAVPSAVGALIYSQVLTVDATFTQFVTSNPYLNLITQTL